jgi:hypothetical protein
MSNSILVATTPTHINNLESVLQGLVYQKNIREDSSAVFTFEYDDWGDPQDCFPTTLMTYLLTQAKMDNYAFVRLGDELDDVEIHGNLDNMDIEFQRKVVY